MNGIQSKDQPLPNAQSKDVEGYGMFGSHFKDLFLMVVDTQCLTDQICLFPNEQ